MALQVIYLGQLRDAVHREMHALSEMKAVARLWSKDNSLWNLSEVLRTFFEQRWEQSYLLICSFFDCNTSNLGALQPLPERITTRLRIPALLIYGPRYLALAGETLKNGLPASHVLMLTGETAEVIVIPGAEYNFGQSLEALAELDRVTGRALRNLCNSPVDRVV
ncbi:MAG: hypothetical protein PVS2B2_22370 [Candidatus Acidiferrum sp.]